MSPRGTLMVFVLLAFCIGCSERHETQSAALADLRFEMPDGWQSHDEHDVSREISRWTPEENPAKESISIIRSSLRGDVKHADATRLSDLLASAQRSLPQGKFQAPTRLRTNGGLEAILIEGSFAPGGQDKRYRRVHALVVDESAVIHVIYTAQSADSDLKAFHVVLDSLRREQG